MSISIISIMSNSNEIENNGVANVISIMASMYQQFSYGEISMAGAQ